MESLKEYMNKAISSSFEDKLLMSSLKLVDCIMIVNESDKLEELASFCSRGTGLAILQEQKFVAIVRNKKKRMETIISNTLFD